MPLVAALLVGCVGDPVERVEAVARTSIPEPGVTVRVRGGAIVRERGAGSEGPHLIVVRALSLDVRVEVESTACEAVALDLEIRNLARRTDEPADTAAGVELSTWVDSALDPEVRLADWIHLPGGAPDLFERVWTPFEGDYDPAAGVVRFRVVADRGRLSLEAGTDLEVPAAAPGACSVLADTESLVGEARAHAVRDGTEGLAFAVWGNEAGNRQVRGQILEAVAADPEILFFVVNGDLSRSGIERDLDAAIEAFDAMPVPWFATLGERDLEPTGADGLASRLGAFNYALDAGPARLIALDSANGSLTSAIYSRLREWLATGDGPDTRLVFMHIPPLDPFGLRGQGFKNRPEASRALAVLQRGEVARVFASHLATWSAERMGNVPVQLTGGGGAPMETDASIGHHWVKVRVGTDGAVGIEPMPLD